MGQYDRKEKSQPKHGKPLDSGASKAGVRPTPGVPGWKGPGYIHKKKKKPPAAAAAGAEAAPGPLRLEHALPAELEQLVLDIFRTTFPASGDFEALKPTLQDIRDALSRGDLDGAFGREDFMEAYAIRWSPSRALAYAQLLAWACKERGGDACLGQLVGGGDGGGGSGGGGEQEKPARVVCFGGGAAEMMAFSAALRHLQRPSAAGRPARPSGDDVSEELEALSVSDATSPPPPVLLDLHLLDAADWSSVLAKLHTGLTTAPALSKYASAAARAANAPFLPRGAARHTFTRADVLGCSTEELGGTIGPGPALLTLLFTLNELYTASMPRTTAFLLRLTEAAPRGSMLLVVDSPGAYAEAAAGGAEEGEGGIRKKYPLSWLVDYVLVPKPKPKLKKKAKGNEDEDEDEDEEAGQGPRWEKVVGEDSMWYRLEESLDYPVSLENMKFQVHLFRRI